MDKLFLLDAYALIYRAYYAFIKNPRINSKGLNTSAIMGFVNTLNEVLKKENPTHIGVAFDPKGPTFRHEAYAEYKAQREETPEDIRKAVPIIKEILRAYKIPILEVEGYEADDVIGTLATKAGEKGINTYMMTPDKDYGQLVKDNVFMYRPRYGDNGFDILGPREVEEKYEITSTLQIIDLLGLMGDASDNIPGCPGVGPKTAVKLINEYGSIEAILENSEKLKGSLKEKIESNKEKIIFSKFLATIKTDVPIELNMDSLKLESPNEDELRKILDSLEFHSLTDRILNKPEKKEKKVELQGDLFAEIPTDYQDSPKKSNFESLKTIDYKYHLIDNEDDSIKLYDFLRTFEILSLDTETTSTEAINAELVGLSFAVKENEAYYVAISSEREEAQKIVNIFKPLYENKNIIKVGQNIKYDYEVLKNYGVTIYGKMFDTMIAHYILQPELHHGMDYLAEIYLNYQTVHIEELIGPKGKNQGNMRDLPPEKVYEYACEDADITLKLKNKLEPELKNVGAEDLFYNIEMPLVRVLADIEMNGVRIDTEALKETSNNLTARMAEIEKNIYKIAGEKFNIASPKQVGEILFDKLKIIDKAKKTKKGQYVTSEEVLQTLRNKSEIVKEILDHRGLKKLLGTYIDALPLLINKRTGKIHTSFNQTITATGRLSSSNPNLQNIPVRDDDGKEIRKAFVPEEGCLFFSADYSQIELRVMAHLSGDENMIEAFNKGQDIHAATAAKIYKEDIEEVSDDQRRKAKRANFGIIYGITVFGLAERLEIDRKEAKELIDGYFETYPKIKDYMEHNIQIAKSQGYIETIFKRRRYLPDINSHNATVRGFAERNAINAPIQGSAADIIKIAMIAIHKRFIEENIQSKMILQVHDELNFSVYPEEKEKVEKIVIQEMQSAYKMRVPLTADCGWGKNWLEAH
jgi:DNA polymerase I